MIKRFLPYNFKSKEKGQSVLKISMFKFINKFIVLLKTPIVA